MAFIDKTIEVAADVHDAYEIWTTFTDYPQFMECVETVTVAEDDQLHWVALMEDEVCDWYVDVVEEVLDTKVVWEALDGRETGEVRFEKLADEATRVTYQLEYEPEAWEGDPEAVDQWMRRRVDDDLESFKELIEAIV